MQLNASQDLQVILDLPHKRNKTHILNIVKK